MWAQRVPVAPSFLGGSFCPSNNSGSVSANSKQLLRDVAHLYFYDIMIVWALSCNVPCTPFFQFGTTVITSCEYFTICSSCTYIDVLHFALFTTVVVVEDVPSTAVIKDVTSSLNKKNPPLPPPFNNWCVSCIGNCSNLHDVVPSLGDAALLLVESHSLHLSAWPGGEELRPGAVRHVLGGDDALLPLQPRCRGEVAAEALRARGRHSGELSLRTACACSRSHYFISAV